MSRVITNTDLLHRVPFNLNHYILSLRKVTYIKLVLPKLGTGTAATIIVDFVTSIYLYESIYLY